MIRFWQSQNMHEHRIIADYLYFAHLNLDAYRKKLEDNLKRRIDELRTVENIPEDVTDTEIEAAASGLDFDEVSIESKWMAVYSASEEVSFTYEFEGLLYQSFFFLWYGFLERRLKELWKLLDTESEKKRSNNRTQGFIYQFHEHLEREFDYKIDKSYWDELILVSKLRNTLIHHGIDLQVEKSIDISAVDSYDEYVTISKELLEYIKQRGVYQTNAGRVLLSRQFCFHLIKFSEKLFEIIGYDLRKFEQ